MNDFHVSVAQISVHQNFVNYRILLINENEKKIQVFASLSNNITSITSVGTLDYGYYELSQSTENSMIAELRIIAQNTFREKIEQA